MRRLALITTVLSGLALGTPIGVSQAQVALGISITVAPPVLPVYEQPPLPGPGYIWTPGYWAYGPDGYYWVPGTWVLPPVIGLLWTPGYWGWRDGFYLWNAGYWGPHVGFYGGIDYGFGYGGVGYGGGEWRNGAFFYNHAANNFGAVRVANTFDRPLAGGGGSRVAFNGGAGGLNARPSAQEEAFARENHVAPTALQTQHQQAASTNRALFVSTNHGQPPIAATSRPGEFSGAGVAAARPGTPAPGPAFQAGARPGAPPIPHAGPPAAAGVPHPVGPPGTFGAPHPAGQQGAVVAPHPVGPQPGVGAAHPVGPQGTFGAPHPAAQQATGSAPHPMPVAPHPAPAAPHPMAVAPHPAPPPRPAAPPQRPAAPPPHVAAPAPHPAAPAPHGPPPKEEHH